MDSWTIFICGIIVGYTVIVICGAIMSWVDAISSRRKAMISLLEERILRLKNANRWLIQRNAVFLHELEVHDAARLFVANLYDPPLYGKFSGLLFTSRVEADAYEASDTKNTVQPRSECIILVERLPELNAADGSTSDEESEGA